MLRTAILLAILGAASVTLAAYEASDDVVTLTPDNFKDTVLKSNELWLLEFYAPWCGHCKNLEPEYKKAATALKGIVNVGAVDADAHRSLGSDYGVQGFPTLKFFGKDKKKPTDFNGQRTAEGLIDAAINELKTFAKQRIGLKGSSSSGGSKPKDDKPKGPSAVVELTDANFEDTVMKSEDVWLVEFFAPWCGHCKNLAPHWEKAAKELEGKIKLGAVDATIHSSLGSKYGIKGYPTIKVFKAGPKSDPVDYDGGRTSDSIVKYALGLYDDKSEPKPVVQLTSADVFKAECESTSMCVIAWLPHILDDKAAGRNAKIAVLQSVSKKFKGKPFSFVWAEAGTQEKLANAMDIGGSGYPAVAVINAKKLRFGKHVGAFTEEAIGDFMKDVLSGKVKTVKVGDAVPAVETSSAWDGKDGELPKEDL